MPTVMGRQITSMYEYYRIRPGSHCTHFDSTVDINSFGDDDLFSHFADPLVSLLLGGRELPLT